MIVPTITINFIGTVFSNPGHCDYGLAQIMAISVGTMTFLKRLPCLQLIFQSSLAIGMIADFTAQRACTRKFYMTSDRHDDGFQHPKCLCCIFLRLSHDDWVVLEKCCIIWAYFFPDANNTLQSRLIFVGIIFIFCRFDAASFPLDTLIPLASFSFLAVLIQHHPLEREQAPIFWLPAWGGADM